MKRSHWYIPLTFLSIVLMAVGVYALCRPTYITLPLFYSGCIEPDRTIVKAERNYVYFPDNVSDYMDTVGYGGCAGWFDTPRCDPQFDTPVTYETLWTQFVIDQEQYTENCGGGICCRSLDQRLYYVEHECRPAGTCGGRSSPGCNSGFTDLGGYCGRTYTFQSHCMGSAFYDEWFCSCPDGWEVSPIVVDVDHSGFSMTDAAGGVSFNMLDDGVPLQISWTAANSTNAFLVLDRNGNGSIDNVTELFGNLTPQPPSPDQNGFLALAEFDKLQNGGNGDGLMNQQDATFSSLRLWQDMNHNGISEASELRTLTDMNLKSIDLDFKESKRIDQYGNQFRYRSKVKDMHDVQLGRWAWDVFIKVQ